MQVFLNHCGRFLKSIWTYLLLSKAHSTSQIKKFHSYVQNQFNKTIKVVISDNGSEFLNQSLSILFQQNGIIHQTSCPYTPQQNARVERKPRQLLEVARALKFQANFPSHFWGHCILTATYLINRLPSKPIQHKSPFECLYGTTIDLTHLRVIGCKTFAHQHLNDKFSARAIPSIFIGYPDNQKGYILYDLTTHKLFTSRHVTFHETNFPFHSNISPTSQPHQPSTEPSPSYPVPQYSPYSPNTNTPFTPQTTPTTDLSTNTSPISSPSP